MIKVGKRKCKLRRLKGKKKTSNPPWIELPADVTANILHRLGAIEILETAQRVCTNWRMVCKDPSMWRVIDMRDVDDLHSMPYSLEIICRHAVDRSQGQLIDINIEYCGTNELLFYIGERCNNLKCLRLARCYDISSEGLTKAVENFPELEELHLFFMTSITAEDIENIGTSCRKLKLFTYSSCGYKNPVLMDAECNGNALAVAKSMPNLHHLGLFGDKMKNEGLEAILNSCPHIESLDIRQCFSIDLRGDLGKRCLEQIKYLRSPNDSTDDCEWDSSIFDAHDLYDDYCSSERSYGSYGPYGSYGSYGSYDDIDSDEDDYNYYASDRFNFDSDYFRGALP